jgi:hypothetical protein
MSALIVIALIYLAFHAGAGHAHYRNRKARGLRPNIYWSSIAGPYASVRLGGFRIGRKI